MWTRHVHRKLHSHPIYPIASSQIRELYPETYALRLDRSLGMSDSSGAAQGLVARVPASDRPLSLPAGLVRVEYHRKFWLLSRYRMTSS